MKHLTTILAAVLCAVCLSGCVDNRTPEERQRDIDDLYIRKIKTVNYRGHSYILYSEFKTGGGITHDPDCPCHKYHPELLNEK